MYNIKIGVDKPDVKRLKETQQALMKRGIRIKDITKLRSTFNEAMLTIKHDMEEKYGIDNVNSAAQISRYLQEMSNYVPYGDRNDYIDTCYIDGKWVTDKYVMNKLSLMGYEFADDLLQYRVAKSNAEKVNSIAENLHADGMLHPHVNMAKTNRVNYSEPAIGQLSKELLQYIIVPLNDTDVLYSIDIKNQEPGILINSLRDKELVEALEAGDGLYETMFRFVYRPYTEMTLLSDTLPEDRIYSQSELENNIMVPDEDYSPMKAPCYGWTMADGTKIVRVQRVCQGVSKESEIEYPETVLVERNDGTTAEVPVTWEKKGKAGKVTGWLEGVTVEISKQERKEFKTSFLAMSYGASQMGIEKQCKIIDAKRLYKRITTLKGMMEYRKMCGAAASRGITTLRTVFGTPVSTDKIGSTSELKRSLLSIPIQGTGADILDLLMTHFTEESSKEFKEKKPYIYFTRHDELFIGADREMIEQYGRKKFENWLKETLEHRINDSTVFHVEVNRIEGMTLEQLLED